MSTAIDQLYSELCTRVFKRASALNIQHTPGFDWRPRKRLRLRPDMHDLALCGLRDFTIPEGVPLMIHGFPIVRAMTKLDKAGRLTGPEFEFICPPEPPSPPRRNEGRS